MLELKWSVINGQWEEGRLSRMGSGIGLAVHRRLSGLLCGGLCDRLGGVSLAAYRAARGEPCWDEFDRHRSLDAAALSRQRIEDLDGLGVPLRPESRLVIAVRKQEARRRKRLRLEQDENKRITEPERHLV